MLKDKDERWNRSERGLEGALLAGLRLELAGKLELAGRLKLASRLKLAGKLEAKTTYRLCLSSDACEPAARRQASSGDRSGNPCSRSACSTPWG